MDRRKALIPGDLWVLEGLTALALFATMALTFVDVIGRYVFSAPIYGATEMIQFLLAITIFSAMGLVSDRDAHITVDLFDAPLSRLFKRWRHVVIGLISVFGLLLIGYELGKIGMGALSSGRRTIVLGWSMAWFTLPGAIMCVIAALLQLNRTLRQT